MIDGKYLNRGAYKFYLKLERLLGSEQSSTGNVDKAKQEEAIPFMKLGHGGHFTFK